MKGLFENIINEFEEELVGMDLKTADVTDHEKEKLELIQDMLAEYEEDPQPNKEEQIANLINELVEYLQQKQDDIDDNIKKVGKNAYALGFYVAEPIAELPENFAGAFAVEGYTDEAKLPAVAATLFLDDMDAKEAIDRAVLFASKKFKKSPLHYRKRFINDIHCLVKKASKKIKESGELANKKVFDLENPDVLVHGFGVLNKNSVKQKVLQRIDAARNAVVEDDYDLAYYHLYRDSLTSDFLSALIDVEEELNTPVMKRKITMMKRKNQ